VKQLIIRLLVVVAGIGSLALIAGAVMLVLRLAQPPENTIDPTRDPAGEVAGRVAKIESGTILVSSESPGSGLVPLVLTRDTTIMVGSTAGWPTDIRPGGQIKVVYDLYEGKRLARSVQVLPDQPARRAAPADLPLRPTVTQQPADPPKSTRPVAAEKAPVEPAKPPAAEPKRRPELPAPSKSAPAVTAPAASPTPASQTAVTPSPGAPGEPMPKASSAPPTAPPPATAAPEAPPAPAPPAPAPTVAAPSAPAPPRPTPPPVRTQEPARSPDSDATDGSAAVDWLLKGRR
jgi:hypothetical protein